MALFLREVRRYQPRKLFGRSNLKISTLAQRLRWPGTSPRLPTLSMIRCRTMGTVVMRWRMRKFLPIVLLAILVQIFAPISASWATGAALSDPLGASAICSNSSGGGSGQTDQSGQHSECCVLCCLGQAASVPLDTPLATVTKPATLPQRVVWLEAVDNSSALRSGFPAQARAPPSLS